MWSEYVSYEKNVYLKPPYKKARINKKITVKVNCISKKKISRCRT